MKNTTLDMSAILDSYTQQVIAEERRRQQVREQVANGTYVPCPGQSDSWNISDRH